MRGGCVQQVPPHPTPRPERASRSGTRSVCNERDRTPDTRGPFLPSFPSLFGKQEINLLGERKVCSLPRNLGGGGCRVGDKDFTAPMAPAMFTNPPNPQGKMVHNQYMSELSETPGTETLRIREGSSLTFMQRQPQQQPFQRWLQASGWGR